MHVWGVYKCCVGRAQDSELLKHAQRELASKQQMLHQVQEHLTQETAAVTTLQARSVALESQLRDTQDKNLSLQSLLQVSCLRLDARQRMILANCLHSSLAGVTNVHK